MLLNRRLEAIEAQLVTNDTPALIIAVQDADSEAALERAKAEYRAEYPSWQGDVTVVVWANSEEVKAALRETIAKLSE